MNARMAAVASGGPGDENGSREKVLGDGPVMSVQAGLGGGGRRVAGPVSLLSPALAGLLLGAVRGSVSSVASWHVGSSVLQCSEGDVKGFHSVKGPWWSPLSGNARALRGRDTRVQRLHRLPVRHLSQPCAPSALCALQRWHGKLFPPQRPSTAHAALRRHRPQRGDFPNCLFSGCREGGCLLCQMGRPSSVCVILTRWARGSLVSQQNSVETSNFI